MMKSVAFLTVLSVIGSTLASEEAIFRVRFGDKFGDGWDGASLSFLTRDYNESYVVGDIDYRDLESEYRAAPAAGDKAFEGGVECADSEDAIYFAMVVGENNTLLSNQEAPVQSWEIYWQIDLNGTIYHGGWNTRMAFTCDGNYTLITSWTENLLETLGSCPECQHPKPKPKPKPRGSDDDKSDDDKRRILGADDDGKGGKPKPKPPLKYWPVPVKLMDVTDKDGWFLPDTLGYAEYTISDASRINLLAEGTLCPSKGTDGYSTVCEAMLPDGHYIFRASGNLDDYSTNYTWQLCGKKAVKYEIGMSDPAITGENATMQYDYRSSTGHMGNEVSFQIKKGKCIVDETVVTVADYVNGSALDTVLTLNGHFLLENVHFGELSSIESSFLESDLREFVNLEVEKTVTVTSVEDGNDGTLVGYRVVAAHAESQLMHGTMDDVIHDATESLRNQMNGGGFVNFFKNNMQKAGLGDDKLMSVSRVQFVDLDFDHLVTLRDGKTMSGDIVAGGDHSAVYNPIISGETEVQEESDGSPLMFDILTASGAFVVIALVVVVVVVVLKPPEASATANTDLDNSRANLVASVEEPELSVDDSSTKLTTSSPQDSALSYQDSLSAALTQRWEMSAEDDSVRL
jgi:hypothetical protein